MSFKDKAEDMMQIILDNQVKELDLKKKLGEGFKNCAITNYVYSQVERNETGDIEYWNIDPAMLFLKLLRVMIIWRKAQ